MNSHVITIGREFGSGGHEIGMKLAERLGVPFYDRELITLAAEQGGIDPKLIERNEEGAHRLSEKGRSRMPFFSLSYTPDFSDAIYLQQCKVIKDLAAKGPCVIVGRCADFVLRTEGSINVFIAASMPYKIQRKRKVAIEKKDYTDEQFERYINDMNAARANYYNHYTNQKWGNSSTYHLCVHSDLVDVDGAVETIVAYLKSVK
ncbi:MAG: cytidylate kinase-like family protein [Clostridiales bacterium]|nr:cytidylate kinase-like family protein [Clostridiales bacterium]MBR5040531.1 cytidylate kinase-like family protein [Clostridiales bacterium]MBR5057366.1 cytidylate kinase-like family protein [Clostridiales bacterium]